MFATRFVCLFSIGLLTSSFAAAAAPLHPASQSAQRAYPVNTAEVAADGKLAAKEEVKSPMEKRQTNRVANMGRLS